LPHLDGPRTVLAEKLPFAVPFSLGLVSCHHRHL
jgi:hypothetical protein